MPLYAYRGDAREVNHHLISEALKVAPAILLDSNNKANIHKFPGISEEKFSKLYVLPGESLYRFKPTLLKLPYYAVCLNVKKIFIGSIPHLFDYDNKEETGEILKQCWDIINWLGKKYEVTIGIIPKTVHEILSSKYEIENKMGHTVFSQRIATDILLNELQQFAKALKEDDRQVYMQLLKSPLKHMGSISYTSSQHVWSFLLLSVILEQQKEINQLKNERMDS